MFNKVLIDDFNLIANNFAALEMFAGKSVLVSGATGFIGKYIVRTLLYFNDTIFSKPANIIALVRNESYANTLFGTTRGDYLKIIKNDITEPLNIDCNINYIIHTAGVSDPNVFSFDPMSVMWSNVIGTKNILELAISKNTESILYLSSAEMYGNYPKNTVIDEESVGTINPLDLRACYSESKRMTETLCYCHSEIFNAPVKIARPFHILGPGLLRSDSRLIPTLLYNYINGQDIVLRSDGQAARTFCYISDAVKAFLMILLVGKNGEAYNIANKEGPIKIADFANYIAENDISGKRKIVFSSRAFGDAYVAKKESGFINTVSLKKLEALGWHPSIPIKEGIRRTIEYMISEKNNASD